MTEARRKERHAHIADILNTAMPLPLPLPLHTLCTHLSAPSLLLHAYSALSLPIAINDTRLPPLRCTP